MRKIINRRNLKSNMVICEDVITAYGSILVNKGTVVDEHILKLLENNNIFEVRVLDTTDVDERIAGLDTHLNTIRKTQKFKDINRKYSLCYANIEGQFNDVINRDQQVDKEKIIGGINTILNKVDTTRELFDALYGMQIKQNLLYMHSINTALTSNLLAHWLKLTENEIKDVTLAGLFHDIGMLMISENILNKDQDELTESESKELQRHAIYGYKYLMKSELNREIGLTALTHHERLDGTGYPLQVKGTILCNTSKIVAIADAYDELTLMKNGSRNPFAIIKEFSNDGLSKYDPHILMVFLEGIINTYIGYDVLLSDERIGTIIYINKNDIACPVIKCGDDYIDLAKDKNVQIVKIV